MTHAEAKPRTRRVEYPIEACPCNGTGYRSRTKARETADGRTIFDGRGIWCKNPACIMAGLAKAHVERFGKLGNDWGEGYTNFKLN